MNFLVGFSGCDWLLDNVGKKWIMGRLLARRAGVTKAMPVGKAVAVSKTSGC